MCSIMQNVPTTVTTECMNKLTVANTIACINQKALIEFKPTPYCC